MCFQSGSIGFSMPGDLSAPTPEVIYHIGGLYQSDIPHCLMKSIWHRERSYKESIFLLHKPRFSVVYAIEKVQESW